ncbi:methyl-accepting chemotaxis protein [Thiomicrorhabdus aquaedulcis]|uniref:methyl-accepting chemotaxis protein n=1 Tax=Thiomicrorhabdus aquaedulcis TaxID=2211106 RepID=UPI000FD92087|nr:methyl-accepting chemotaxis protein [Thiomicrorhabdus aquaedulcis]
MQIEKEYELPKDLVILSTADLQGNIVDFNEGFRLSSGYSRAELLGKPHNLLRHSDMPKEAFKDFWHTIQAGKPWYGVVKNKRKNGDYYWVAANASPVIKAGKVTGYLSVRYPATLAQKQSASVLYAKVKAGDVKFPYTQVETRTRRLAQWALPLMVGFAALMYVSVQAPINLAGMLGVGAAALIMSFLAYRIVQLQGISPQLQQGMQDIANGHYEQKINDSSEWGFALNMVRSRVAEFAARNYDALRESAVLTTALDAASTNIMVADPDLNIVSINSSLKAMFTRNQAALQADFPHFSAQSVVGSNMDLFHKNPAHQRALIESLTDSWSADISMAKLTMRLTVVPIIRQGEKLGYVVEWLDRTDEADFIAQVAWVVEGMTQGTFNRRITQEAHGVLAIIKDDINQAVDVTSNAIAGINQVIGALSVGDLTQECVADFGGDLKVLKDTINRTVYKLREVVGAALETSNIVSQDAQGVSRGSMDLSQRVQEQAAALEQTSATMDQMNSAVQQNTDNAHQTANVAKEVETRANAGAQVMKQTIDAMNSIQQSSHKIADIVSLIDGIAFQTNLLALNAAVEAARAGEHGRGFAVVASEVRNLSQKSAEAAKDIKILITESVARIDDGTKLAAQSGEVLHGINQSIGGVSAMINQIAQASAEQAQGINQVHQAIAQIDNVTQQNAALVEQTSSAAVSLSEQASILKVDMGFFKISAH